MQRAGQLASFVCLAAVAACSSDSGGRGTAAGSQNATGATSGSASGGSGSAAGGAESGAAAATGAASTGAAGAGGTGAASGNAGTGAMGGGGSASAMGDGGMSSGAAAAGDGGAASDGTSGIGQFTITFDASAPNHFGPEHAGLTAYAELVDMTGGMKKRVGDIYSSPMTTTGYAKWVWQNVGVAGHTYTFAIFDDAATMNPTCKGGMPPAGDAGWTFPVNGGMPITGDYRFIFPTGQAIRDPNKCAWFPMGPIMGAIPVPTP